MARILLMDDEKHIRQRYTEELSRDGYEAATLDSGDGLVERICFLQPDVVVLDIRLGDGWNGLDLLQDIKNRFFERISRCKECPHAVQPQGDVIPEWERGDLQVLFAVCHRTAPVH